MNKKIKNIEKIYESFGFVSSYAGDCDDWVAIKKQVLLNLPSELRKNFSTRDPRTKEQWLNEFEKEMITYYKDLTGTKLVLRTLSERKEIFGVL